MDCRSVNQRCGPAPGQCGRGAPEIQLYRGVVPFHFAAQRAVVNFSSYGFAQNMSRTWCRSERPGSTSGAGVRRLRGPARGKEAAAAAAAVFGREPRPSRSTSPVEGSPCTRCSPRVRRLPSRPAARSTAATAGWPQHVLRLSPDRVCRAMQCTMQCTGCFESRNRLQPRVQPRVLTGVALRCCVWGWLD